MAGILYICDTQLGISERLHDITKELIIVGVFATFSVAFGVSEDIMRRLAFVKGCISSGIEVYSPTINTISA